MHNTNIVECIRRFMRAEYKMSIDTIKKRCPEITLEDAELLVKEGVLRKYISFRDPGEGVELKQIDYSLVDNFLKSKPRLLNKNTGIQYRAEDLIQVSVYQITNPVSLYNGLEPTRNKTLKEVTIFGCDLVSFSEGLSEKQIRQYENLKRFLSFGLNSAGLSPAQCFAISSGDGFFLIFINVDVDLIFNFTDLTIDLIEKENNDLPMRFAIHSGLVFLIECEDTYRNAIGHALNATARVLSFGDKNHILVTEEFYKLRIAGSSIQNNFHDTERFGIDKHGNRYKIFNYYHGKIGNKSMPTKLLD